MNDREKIDHMKARVTYQLWSTREDGYRLMMIFEDPDINVLEELMKKTWRRYKHQLVIEKHTFKRLSSAKKYPKSTPKYLDVSASAKNRLT